MNKRDAKEILKGKLTEYVESITDKSKGKNMYVCPLCGSGTGTHGTGAFSIAEDGEHWKCFACGESGDLFDLLGKFEGIEEFPARLERAADLFHVSIDGSEKAGSGESGSAKNHAAEKKPIKKEQDEKDSEEEPEQTAFILQAAERIEETTYHRGISIETLKRYSVGYCPEWRHPKAPKSAPTSPRLIIPTSPTSYLARDTRENIPETQRAYSKSKVGHIHMFNTEALAAAKPVFIVEGEIDALSIIDVGGEAVALGTTSKAKALLDLIRKENTRCPFIIYMDNDKPGEKASKELIDGLTAMNIPFQKFAPKWGYKDANEALQRDRKRLAEEVKAAEAMRSSEAEELGKQEAYLHTSTAYYLQSFIDGITASVDTPSISTGFQKLDEALDGGLYEGLYIIGAISSLGKTTFATQMADQIAQQGQDVLIFSLEMARTEIMAKSISRHTIQNVISEGGSARDAKTSRGITEGKRYQKYSKEEKELITKSIKDYGEYASHIFISEGVGDIGALSIRKTVQNHILFTGVTPVIIVDYIQILAPWSDRATDKQNIDKAVLELKRISRDYKTPVIGISSFNRANYRMEVTMEAFKESGAIEYSSDVLIGLQLKGAGAKDFNATDAKKKNPREVELVVLKNRNGRTGDKIGFSYYPLFNYFKEVEKS